MLSEYKIKKAEGFGSVAHTASGTGTRQVCYSHRLWGWEAAPVRCGQQHRHGATTVDCLTVPRGHIPVMCLNADHSQRVTAKGSENQIANEVPGLV